MRSNEATECRNTNVYFTPKYTSASKQNIKRCTTHFKTENNRGINKKSQRIRATNGAFHLFFCVAVLRISFDQKIEKLNMSAFFC